MTLRLLKFPLLFLFITGFSVAAGWAHTLEDSLPKYRKVYLGPGLGLNYGGIGVQLNYMPVKTIRLSAGYGTNLLTMAYSLGINYRILADKRICPTASYYYGFNGSIQQKKETQFNKTFYGSTLGAGVEFWNRRRVNFFHLQLLVPIRSFEFNKSIEEINKISEEKFNVIPLTVSLGFHFGINK